IARLCAARQGALAAISDLADPLGLRAGRVDRRGGPEDLPAVLFADDRAFPPPLPRPGLFRTLAGGRPGREESRAGLAVRDPARVASQPHSGKFVPPFRTSRPD